MFGRCEGELMVGPARVHAYTYRYESPSRQTRSPGKDLLAFMEAPVPDATGVFHTPAGSTPRVRIGAMMLIPDGASISADGSGGERRIVTCSMQGGLLPSVFDREDHDQLGRCGDIRDDRLTFSMRRLGQEARDPGFASEMLVDALTVAIQIDLARYFRREPQMDLLRAGGLAPWQLRRVEEHVRDTEGRPIRVAELANIAGVSSRHFMRAFRQSTGSTVHAFVRDVQVARARALLVEGRMPLKQIAERLGFATPSSFSLAFRRAVGTTPARYREEVAVRR